MYPATAMLRVLLLIAIAQIAALCVCFLTGVPLGKPGTFTYLYSPVVWDRITAPALPIAALLTIATAAAAFLSASADATRRRAGVALLGLSWPAWAAWTFVAPPNFIHIHSFNMISPSHDGAFTREALKIDSLTGYLQAFPQRARTPPEQMGGTRVISNPPGATMLARVAIHGLGEARLVDSLLLWGTPQARDMTWAERTVIRRGIAFALVLQAIWLLSAPLLYLLARQWLDPPNAAVLATIVFLSPATVLFSPGKDPAQLLTVALPLLLWAIARRGNLIAAAAAGVAFTLALLVGLVHLWVAVIVLAATIWSVLGEPVERRTVAARRLSLIVSTAALAGIATMVLLWLGWRLNLPAALLAAAQSQSDVTRGPNAMSAAWQALGLPLFVLFCGPALLYLIAWLRFGRLSARGGVASEAERATDARLADGLLIASVLVMLCTVTFTNAETPRLWIPFMPLLVLGAALQLPVFRSPTSDPSRGTILATLVAAQLLVTMAQWVLMDMREAETRLLLDPSGAARLFH